MRIAPLMYKFMNVNRIRSINDPHFEEAWRIYNDNFPHEERRTLAHKETALNDEKCYFELFTENGKSVGIACYWIFDEYLYVEHLAIDKAAQGGGYGTKLLDYFKKESPGIVILEIEPVVDDITARRQRFYERFGFVVNEHKHILPQYHDDSPDDMEMVLMTYPAPIDDALFARFLDELHGVVMYKE